MPEKQSEEELPNVRAVFGMAFFDCGALNLALGDLVITDQAIVFLWYTEVHVKGSAGGLIGTAVGGAGLGIAAGMSDQSNINAGIEGVAMLQEKIYGLSLQQRIERFERSQVFPMEAVAGLILHDEQAITITLKNGEEYSYHFRYEFATPYKDLITTWPNDTCLYDRGEDASGFYLGADSPSALLDNIVNGDAAATEKIAALSDDSLYAAGLYNELSGYTKDERARIYDFLSQAPPAFQAALKDEAKKASSSAIGSMFAWVFFGSIFSGAFFYQASEQGGSTLYNSLAIGCAVLAVVFMISEIGPIRENARIKTALK